MIGPGLIAAIVLAVACFIILALVMRLPRRTWEVVAAALFLGLAGYALQGSPSSPGAPKAPVEGGAGAAAAASAVTDGKGPVSGDKLVITAKAFARHGQFADAAGILRTAVKKDPRDGEAWLLLANTLVAHAEGNLTPAALLAFGKAGEADPTNPGPPIFLGLALAQSGRLEEGRELWADLLSRSPKDAPWRSELETSLARLDALIARQQMIVPNR